MQNGNTLETFADQALLEGLAAISAKNYKSVHSDCISMIKRDVHNPVPYALLGLIAAEHDNIGKAIDLYEKAVAYGPGEVRYLILKAQALSIASRHVEAKITADQAAKSPPPDAHFADTLGVVYSRCGFHELAIPFFKRAVRLNPKPANFHYNLASSLQFSGKFQDASAAYEAALARDPNMYRAQSAIVGLSKQTKSYNRLETLLSEFERLDGNADAMLHLGHAIAETYEGLGEYPESLNWLKKAKAKKRAELSYDPSMDTALFASAKASVPAYIHEKNTSSASPIFIVGLPRTGTTLVDRILSSHSQVTSAGELNVFAGLLKRLSGVDSKFVIDGPTLKALADKSVSGVGLDYVEMTRELARGSQFMIDKMPLNFLLSGFIHRALPNARIVVLRRGAMDSCLSNYRQLFSTKFSYYNYTFDLEDTARFYKKFDALIAHFRLHLPANRFLEVSYENIVLDQDHQTRRLLAFCGLEFEEACLRFNENSAPVSTASSVQVRQPLYSGAIGRWKRYGETLSGLSRALGDLANQ